jgi:TonB-dependent receptor
VGLAVGSLALGGSVAFAADNPSASDTPAAPVQEVVVTGTRQSLKTAKDLKKDSVIIQDSISAQDIGALPDQSVTEALQRVPGVNMNQFAAGVDPDHFSIEGSGITVRGLDSRTRSELNGRDTFSANNGRAISFADIPPELLIGVDVYKTPEARTIEGGIAGTVNLRTRVPFDSPGQIISLNVQENYGDFIDQWRPGFSGLYSNRWNSDIGEFGILANYVDSKLNSRADGIQASNFGCRSPSTVPPDPVLENGTAVTSPAVTCPANASPGQANSGPGIFFPRGAAFRSEDIQRERKGVGAAAQWKSPDNSLLATVQFLRSDSTEAWTEHAVEIATDNVTSSGDSFPVPNSPAFGVSAAGVFTNGQITDQNGYRADQWGGSTAPFPTTGAGSHRVPVHGLQSNNIERNTWQEYITQDTGFNLKWDINDKLRAKLDLQYVTSSVFDLDDTIWGSSFQDINLAINGGSTPTQYSFQPIYNVNTVGSTCTVPATSNNCSNYYNSAHASYSDPYNSFWRSAMDHLEASDGNEKAAALDFAYSISDEGWARSTDFGVRWSDRNETTRFSTYNWGVLSEIWGNNGPIWMDNPTVPNAANIAPYAFTNFFQGQVPVPTGKQPLPFYTGNTATNYAQYVAFAEAVRNAWLAQNGLTEPPGCGNSGASSTGGWVPLALRCGVVPGTPFKPGEINPVDEKTKDAFAQLNFGHEFGDHKFSGNIGLRYTKTDRVATGFLSYPSSSIPTCTPPPPTAPAGTLGSPTCQLSAGYIAQLAAWANGANFARNAGSGYGYLLPSLNVKFGLTNDLILRGSISRSITPPQIGYVRGDYTLASLAPNPADLVPCSTTAGQPNDPHCPAGANGTLLINTNGVPAHPYQSNGTFGNPALKPESADNFDLSMEWYYGPVSYMSVAAFYKRLHDVVVNNTSIVNFTNAGVTLPAVLTQPGNSHDIGKLEGIELAVQQTFDFLPKPLDGLGISANYSFLHSQGVAQSTLSSTDPNVGAGNVTNINIALLPLEGLSKNAYNATLFYNKGAFDGRLSWNWRSAFLLTARDVIVPYAPIMNENTGTLDASMFYSVTKEIKVGVQAANLLDNITRTSQVLDNALLRAPRSFFIEDRRVSLIVRATF